MTQQKMEEIADEISEGKIVEAEVGQRAEEIFKILNGEEV